MIMSLGAIGLNTNFKEVSKSGFFTYGPWISHFSFSSCCFLWGSKVNGTNLDQLSGLFLV